ncbi:MAG: hypothetical protein DRH08_03010 [Deltaproteobacteria bacterium]|nr:MAG: hypothetical protein DRH08_03010 [Deltaproteobacteria bacterium]
MGAKRTIIHCNGSLKHQVEIAGCLQAGMGGEISYKADTDADLHVVLGPWFALKQWRFANTLYIDRAYWGDPDCVSIHWLKDGEKVRSKNNGFRPHPKLKPLKTGKRTVILCDYGMNGADLSEKYGGDIKRHPAEGDTQPLSAVLEQYSVAVGRRTTALVDAAIAGLTVHTDDPFSPVWPISGQRGNRQQWLNDLAWHNWSKTEISSGEFLNGIGNSNPSD